MQYSAQLHAVTDVIKEWTLSHHKPFDHILNAYFRGRRYIGAKDRQIISLLCYEVFRHKLLLEWWAEWGTQHASLETEANYALKLVLVYLTLVVKRSPGEVNAICDGSKYGLPQLTRVERKLIETLWNKPDYGKHALHHDTQDAHIQLNIPKWLYTEIETAYGVEEATRLMQALNQPATIDLRINTLKDVTREAILYQLKAQKIDAELTELSPWGIRIHKRFNLNTFQPYETGEVEIQDEGSQLLAWVSDAKPNTTVIDYCAGAGGKSLVLGMVMQNKGKLILSDTSKIRLDRATDRLKRAGVFNVQQKVILNTPQGDAVMNTLVGKADTVLIDAPCSGSGTWRRNPDAKFRLTPNQLQELTGIQSDILHNAANLVRPKGVMVYATCSVLPAENQHQVSAFLSTHPEFELSEFTLQNQPYTQLQLTPHQHQTDGFFVAKLRRK